MTRRRKLKIKFSNCHKIKVSNCSSSFHPWDLKDMIGELEYYFELGDIIDPQRVRLAQTKLKGHATLWWKELQKDRVENGEIKITRQRVMVSRLKDKFIPEDYEIDLFMKLQNLKQDISVKVYIE